MSKALDKWIDTIVERIINHDAEEETSGLVVDSGIFKGAWDDDDFTAEDEANYLEGRKKLWLSIAEDLKHADSEEGVFFDVIQEALLKD